jgi:UPF0042 nucleotide-binding protein
MKLMIVSGLSGAGKTVALHSLEDLGAYCIDNLPVNLLPAVAQQAGSLLANYPCVAVGVDARNIGLQDIPTLSRDLRNMGIPYEILFLEAGDNVLIQRFSETRRKHPLTFCNLSLPEAIRRERELLDPLASRADLRIDTSRHNVHQLREAIRSRLNWQAKSGMSLLFQSFGFKHGVPQDADFVFDTRCLPNPHWETQLRPLTGKDQPVIEFLQGHAKVGELLLDIIAFLEKWLPQFAADSRSYLTVGIGCTGGQHRSVYVAERLAAHFQPRYENVLVNHRELP